MRLALPLAALELLVLGTSCAAFSPVVGPNFVSRSRTANVALSARTPVPIDPEDPYAKLLEAYSKKGSPIAEAASRAVPPTPPPAEVAVPDVSAVVPDLPTDAITDTSRALSDAVDAASAAADQASSAAASITASAAAKFGTAAKATTAATAAAKTASTGKVAAATAAATATGKVPTLAEYVQKSVETGGLVAPPSSSDSAFAGFDRLIENLLGAPPQEVQKSLEGIAEKSSSVVPLVKSGAVIGGAGAAASLEAPDLSGLSDKISELGTALQNSDFDSVVQSLHLQEYGGWYVAAAAVLIAATQRQAGKDEAWAEYQVELAQAQGRADEAAAAADVAARGARLAKDLATQLQSNADVGGTGGESMLESSKYREMEVEKKMMQKEMTKLKQDTAELRKQLQIMTQQMKKEAIAAGSAKAAPRVYETLERDPDEDSRILQVLKEIDEENAAIKAKATVAMEKAEKKREATAAALALEKKAAESAKKEAVKPKTKKASPIRKKKVVEARKAESKAQDTEKAEDIVNPWASLSESTLKRKTIAQLSEYLAERGVSVAEESGKKPKKADLVSAVQTLH